MASIVSSDIPKPKDWQDFERLTKDAYAIKWESPELQMNGRQGQAQNGVDIFGHDYLGQYAGIQCKHTASDISLDLIRTEIENAEEFHDGDLQVLHIATTAKRDAQLQKDVRALSKTRCNSGNFAVGLIYWDDIISGLIQSKEMFNRHFPDLQLSDPLSDSNSTFSECRAALNLGWYGCKYDEHLFLVLGEFGWMAGEDPDKVRVQGEFIKTAASLILSTDEAAEISTTLDQLLEMYFETSDEEFDRLRFQQTAKRITSRIQAQQKLLKAPLAQFLDLGHDLSHIFHHVDDDISDKKKDQLVARIMKLLPNEKKEDVVSVVFAELKYPSGYNRTPAIYSFVYDALFWAEI